MVRHLAFIRHDSSFKLHKLVAKKEDGHYIVGRAETEVYVTMPKEGFDVLTFMHRGFRVEEIEKRKPDADVRTFIYSMIDHGFVSYADHKEIIDSTHKSVRDVMPWLSKKHVAWLFSNPLKVIYTSLIMLMFVLFIVEPLTFPRATHFFFTDNIFLLMILSGVFSFIFVFMHELAHYAAARSRGIIARFGITTRAMYLVFITDVTNLYTLPRKERYRVMLAGMVNDLVVMSIAVLLAFLLDANQIMPWLVKFLRFVAIMEVLGLFWQFLLFLRTDIYYTIENYLRIDNLHSKSKEWLISAGYKTFRGGHHGPVLDHVREWKWVKLYGGIMVAGFGALFFLLVFYTLPIIWGLFTGAVSDIKNTLISGTIGNLVEAIVFLTFFSLNQTLFFQSLIRERKLHHNKWFLWGSLLLFIVGNYFISYFLLIVWLVSLPAFLVYILSAGTGCLFGALFCWIIEHLNEMEHRVVVYDWLFVPFAAIIFSIVLSKLVQAFILTTTQTIEINIFGLVVLYGIGLLGALLYADRTKISEMWRVYRGQ